jgi:hypothetical protein
MKSGQRMSGSSDVWSAVTLSIFNAEQEAGQTDVIAQMPVG